MPPMEHNPPIRIVAAVIRDRRGRVLLVRKQGTTAFMQPGGKREPYEDDATALAREVEEEIGCCVDPRSLRFLATLTAPAANEIGRVVEAAIYRADVEGTPVPRAEIADLIWIDPRATACVELAPLTRNGVFPLLLEHDR